MSAEDEKIPGDKTGNTAKDMAQDAKEAASNFADEAKETVKEFGNSAKEAASDVKEEWNKMTGSTDNKKILAGILAIIFGSLGVHKFILGYQKEGVLLLVATVIGYATSCIGIGLFILAATGVVGFIEGIIYLTKSDTEFFNTYQAGKKPWF